MTADDPTQRARRVLEGVLGVPVTEGNRVDPLRNGCEIFPAMFDAIEKAEHTIDFLTFIYWRGEVGSHLAEVLAKKAKAGVRVRVLLDAYGARPMDPAAIDIMHDNGVVLRWFRPLNRFRPLETNHRTHRKVMIVDEAVAFTGGVGIADEWKGDARNEHEWRDTHFRFEGPVVDGLRAAFLDNWVETDPVLFDDVDRFPHQPQPGHARAQCVRGASETGWSDIATLFRTLVQLAAERVRIATAYFVPSMLHAKVMTVDGCLANIGSANLNSRSMALDEEINVVVLDPSLVKTLDEHFDDDLERCAEIEPGRWEERSATQRAYERLATPIRRFF